MPTTSCESIELQDANRKITDLQEEIRRLSDELLVKKSLLANIMDVATGQSKRIASLSAALQDTVLWDPSTDPRQAASTPYNDEAWTEVKRGRAWPRSANSPPRMRLSNRFEPLADHGQDQAHSSTVQDESVDRRLHLRVPADDSSPSVLSPPAGCSGPSETVPVSSSSQQSPSPTASPAAGAEAPAQQPSGPREVSGPDPPAAARQGGHHQQASADIPLDRSVPAASSASVDTSQPVAWKQLHHRSTSGSSKASTSSRRRLLQEAVRRRSEGRSHPVAVEDETGALSAAERLSDGCSPPGCSSAQHQPALSTGSAAAPAECPSGGYSPPEHSSTQHQPVLSTGSATAAPLVRSPQPPATEGAQPAISPLFPPTTVIIGDSIIKNIRFFDAVTFGFPGATVPIIIEKIRELLPTLPITVNRIIVHVGTNDASRHQSELTKVDFISLIDFLRQCGKAFFISGPIPTFCQGDWRFSSILSLHTWLESTCGKNAVHFIDNFNLFWNRADFFNSDGTHPSSLGVQHLAANIQHIVLSTRNTTN